MPSMAEFLLGQTRASVLGALLLRPKDSLHVRELARLTGASPGSLHRDLRAMSEMGLLLRREVGRQVHYSANVDSPIFQELAALLRKTAGLVDILRDALAPVADEIDFAFVYGSMAKGTEHARSDVDLLVVGGIDYPDAVMALVGAQEKLQREVNPSVFSRSEFAHKLKLRDAFVSGIWKGPKLWVIGNEKAGA